MTGVRPIARVASPGRRRLLHGAGALALALGGAVVAGCDRLPGAGWDAAGLRVIDERQTRFGRLAVVERGRVRYLAYGPGARLVFQSALDIDRPHELHAPYMRLMMLGMVYAPAHRNVLQIGIGAGNMAGYAIRNFPSATVHAVEIDANAVQLGLRYFGLEADPRLHLHIEDGRTWLAATDERFDVVMLDAYDDETIPEPLMQPAFFELVAAHLNPGGVMMQNVFLPQADEGALLAAVRTAFERIDAYRIGESGVIAAYQGEARGIERLRARARELDVALRPVHPLAALLAYRVPAL